MGRPRKDAVKQTDALLATQEVAEIPVEEQPYPLPEGWKWVKLGSVAEIIMGQSPAGSETTDDNSFLPLIGGASDMGILYPEPGKYTKKPTKISNNTDIIICIRATLGRPIFSDGKYCLGRGVAAIRSKVLSSKFLRFFILNFEQYLFDNATGSTFAQVNSSTLHKMPLPLPPRHERQRIVNSIESLFAKLDEAKEQAEAVLDGIETRKAAILHKAFTGELTERWRKKNDIPFDSWIRTSIGKILKVSSGKGLTFKKMDNSGKIPVYGGNGITGYHNQSNVTKDTIVIGRVGYYCGSVHYVKENSWVTDNALIVFFDNTKFDNYFIYYVLSYTNLRQNDSATAQPVISGSKIYPIEVTIMGLAEQREIVRILDFLIAKGEQARDAAETVLKQIELMKKSILARAFRGELSQN